MLFEAKNLKKVSFTHSSLPGELHIEACYISTYQHFHKIILCDSEGMNLLM